MDNDANRSHTTVPPRPSQVPRPVRPTLGATEAAQTARQHMMAQHRSDYRQHPSSLRHLLAVHPLHPLKLHLCSQ